MRPTGLTALCLPRHRCSASPPAACGPTGHLDHPTAQTPPPDKAKHSVCRSTSVPYVPRQP
jgi:hypothetical protein